MTKFLYQTLFGFLFLVSLLPFWMLRIYAYFFYIVFYYVIPYRKKLVFENIQKSFPEKSPKEVKKIAQAYFLHSCDLAMESIKGVSMNQKDFAKHYKILNWEVLFEKAKGGSVIALSPHTGNWEWVFSMVEKILLNGFDDVYAVYQPMKYEYVDEYVLKTRQRYGVKMIPMQETFKRVLEAHAIRRPVLSWFAADQSPAPEKAYWTTFLNHPDTPFHKGYEKIAFETNQPVLFLDIKKVKRNYYELSFIPITDNPIECEENEIVDAFVKLTEKRITEDPPYWLWSHNRWKHKRIKPEPEKILEN